MGVPPPGLRRGKRYERERERKRERHTKTTKSQKLDIYGAT